MSYCWSMWQRSTQIFSLPGMLTRCKRVASALSEHDVSPLHRAVWLVELPLYVTPALTIVSIAKVTSGTLLSTLRKDAAQISRTLSALSTLFEPRLSVQHKASGWGGEAALEDQDWDAQPVSLFHFPLKVPQRRFSNMPALSV
jgi:hypothetical protein